MTEPAPASNGDGAPPHPLQRLVFPCLGGLLLLLVIGGLTALWFRSYAVGPGPGSGEQSVYIPPGSGFSTIRQILRESGVIDNDIRFVILARYQGVSRSLKAGEYEFTAGQSPSQILQILARGKTALRQVSMPEGTNIFQASRLLEQQGWTDQERFLELVQDRQFITSLELSVASLEGYLFPDTYLFPKGEELTTIIRRMVVRGQRVVEEECSRLFPKGTRDDCQPQWLDPEHAAQSQGALHSILTLASIVEKETGLAEERSLVAGVFVNRLHKGMLLQADPTVIYGLKKFDIPLSKRDLKTATPYNTYMNKGLPPSPICNPGRAAIRAVLDPAEEDFYYFVAQGDGSHYFSKNLKEHNRAVSRLRRWERQQKTNRK